ncbi:MAG TPA: hypothetical protein VLM11_08280 [Streptosporangiaceae bacterium]|nr:hypothetical protein [Streptosporangiaceae bacterium]
MTDQPQQPGPNDPPQQQPGGYFPPYVPPGQQQPQSGGYFPPPSQGYGPPPPGYGPPPGYYMPGPPPPMGPPPRQKHTLRNVLLGIVGALVLIIALPAIAAALSSGKPSGNTPAASTSSADSIYAPPAPADTPTPTPAGPVVVHFAVVGTGYPSITYGSDSSNITPPGSYGPLGDGVATPFRASLKFDPSAQYYQINAQLEGSGSITCRIWISAPGYNDLTVASGSASGGYNICSAQAAANDPTGLNWTKE